MTAKILKAKPGKVKILLTAERVPKRCTVKFTNDVQGRTVYAQPRRGGVARAVAVVRSGNGKVTFTATLVGCRAAGPFGSVQSDRGPGSIVVPGKPHRGDPCRIYAKHYDPRSHVRFSAYKPGHHRVLRASAPADHRGNAAVPFRFPSRGTWVIVGVSDTGNNLHTITVTVR